MNLEFLIVALIIGRAVDWIFQSQYQAYNKTKNFWALAEHSITYALCTTVFVLGLLYYNKPTDLLFEMRILLFLFYSHMLIDNRWIVKQIMMLKGLSKEQAYGGEFGWLELGIDQRLHDVVILGIALVI